MRNFKKGPSILIAVLVSLFLLISMQLTLMDGIFLVLRKPLYVINELGSYRSLIIYSSGLLMYFYFIILVLKKIHK